MNRDHRALKKTIEVTRDEKNELIAGLDWVKRCPYCETLMIRSEEEYRCNCCGYSESDRDDKV